MNLTLMFRVVCYVSLVVVLAVWETSAPAAVITTGDVDPGGTGTQPDLWNMSDDLTVGLSGSGTLNVAAGGVVNNKGATIGHYSDSTGVASITGSGSRWNSSRILYVGRLGSGTLNVEAGGVVTSAQEIIMGSMYGSTGMATIAGSGSRWNSSSNLTVGYEGTGTLNVEAGGVVNNEVSFLSISSGSTGTATITGSGSQWNNSSDLYLGQSGSGTLNVTDGGVVTNANDGFLGFNEGSTGMATITGSGSQWNNSGELWIGRRGSGTLNVEAGGVVNNEAGFLGYICAYGRCSTGEATITGSGSRWNSSRDLTVGREGSGTLNVEAGGVVNNEAGFLGYSSGSTGTATITGTNSIWDNSSSLYVGEYGTVTIENGGRVENTNGYIGIYSGASGTVKVNGTVSTWENDGDLYIGGWSTTDGGSSDVSIQDGGTLSVTGDTKIYSGSTLTLSGAASTLELGGAFTNAGTFDWQSGTLRDISGTATAVGSEGLLGTSVLLGPGKALAVDSGLNVESGGTLTLSGGELTLGGAFTNTGTFDWQSGTVALEGGSSWAPSGNFDLTGSQNTHPLWRRVDARRGVYEHWHLRLAIGWCEVKWGERQLG